MWQRFTERARKAVFFAQEEAQRFGSGYVSTEHLLLGLLREANRATEVLESCHVSCEAVGEEIEKILPYEETRQSQDMTLTPRAKRVIDLSYEEARNLGHNYIGTEHLILGLIREGDGLAGRVLAKLGVELEAARRAVILLVGESTAPEATTAQKSDVRSAFKTWSVLAARRQRMPADQLCLMFLFEENGDAERAVVGCGADPSVVATLVEEEMLERKTPDELKAGFLRSTDLLVLAGVEATNLGQALTGAHFLLGTLTHGDTAMSRALTDCKITYDKLREWLAANP